MQTRRQYAASLGLAKIGRGKLSTAAHEAINAARANGMKFSDDTEFAPVVVKREKVSKDTDSAAPVGINVYANAQMFYPWDQKFEGRDVAGKRHIVDVRQSCYDGPYSIMGCPNRTHKVLVSSMEWITVSPIGE